MQIAVAQMNCHLGDLKGNSHKILQLLAQAKKEGASLLLTPELALTGYPPEDLLLREGFYHACDEALVALASQVQDITLVLGHPCWEDGKTYNAASVIQNGKVIARYFKHNLPNYSVFDEQRYFEAGIEPCVFDLDGICFGVNICEDIWESDSVVQVKSAGAQVLLALNASPYAMGKHQARLSVLAQRVAETGMSIVYANMVGGQDELVFDGASFAMNLDQTVTAQAEFCQESLLLVGVSAEAEVAGCCANLPGEVTGVYQVLCLGVKDYVQKNRFPGVVLGLSGGIDSALTLAIAVDAIGADKVHAVMMPSPYTAQISLDDSREMINLVNVTYDEYSIEPMFKAYLDVLQPAFQGRAVDTTEENLQARIRGAMLMALSNKLGSVVLTTGNKSEMSVGYATLYGDMAGGFAVLKDVYKTLVYQLAKYRNTLAYVIPERIITRPPSAELRPDQTDQDSLPPYEILDAIVRGYMEQNQSVTDLIKLGYSELDVRRVVGLVRISEYKRRQAAVGVRVTERAYGKDWRYPITVRYQDNF